MAHCPVMGSGRGGIDADSATAQAKYVRGARGNTPAKTFLTAGADDPVSGTMPYHNAGAITIGRGGTYTVPEGEHSGSEKVSFPCTVKGATTITPGLDAQSIAAGVYMTGNVTVKGSAVLTPSNIASGHTVCGIAGTMETIAVSQTAWNLA